MANQVVVEHTSVKSMRKVDLEAKVARRQKLSAEIKALEAEKDEISTEIEALMEAGGVTKVGVGAFIVAQVTKTTRTLQKEVLLEKGVPVDVIAAATKETPSTYITVSERK